MYNNNLVVYCTLDILLLIIEKFVFVRNLLVQLNVSTDTLEKIANSLRKILPLSSM